MYQLLSTPRWKDYELIDSGEEEKLERWGSYVIRRPEPKALWKKSQPTIWDNALATYQRSNEGGGKWLYHHQIPKTWHLQWETLTFEIKLTSFKHTGLFPEQVAVWRYIRDTITATQRPINVLNLFAYTGGSTLAALSAGASVTHVDASKEVLTWARENAKLSGLADKSVRWIPEDVVTYVRREAKRGVMYDAIILDPPKFGRGERGEVWKFEDLPKLLELCSTILTDNPLFVFLNTYTVNYSSLTLHNVLKKMMVKYKGKTTYGDLGIAQSNSDMILPLSTYAYWEQH